MHRGHRSLAEAATRLGGYPCLLSFWGMAEVLELPPRAPLTADADRARVLRGWAPHCGGLVPMQRSIPFAAVRELSPEAFVVALAEGMAVRGVVAGENYRFGEGLGRGWEALPGLLTPCARACCAHSQPLSPSP